MLSSIVLCDDVFYIKCKLCILGKLTPAQKKLLDQNAIQWTNEYNVPFSKVIELYQKCDLVSFVSTYEGFGMPILEGQATGRADEAS